RVDALVLLKGKQELSSRVVILIMRRQPDPWRHFGLLHRDDPAAIELSKKSSTKGDVARHPRFPVRHLSRFAIHPDLGHHMGERILKQPMGAEVRIWIEFENIASASTHGGGSQPPHRESLLGRIHEFGAI